MIFKKKKKLIYSKQKTHHNVIYESLKSKNISSAPAFIFDIASTSTSLEQGQLPVQELESVTFNSEVKKTFYSLNSLWNK